MRMGRSPPFHPRFAVTVAACPGLSRASPPTILDTFLPRPTYRIYIRWLDEITSHLLNAPCRPFLNNWRQLSPVSIGNGSKCWSDCLLLISDACWSHRLRVTMACGSDCGISGHLYQFSGQFPHYRFHYQSFSTGIYIYIYIYAGFLEAILDDLWYNSVDNDLSGVEFFFSGIVFMHLSLLMDNFECVNLQLIPFRPFSSSTTHFWRIRYFPIVPPPLPPPGWSKRIWNDVNSSFVRLWFVNCRRWRRAEAPSSELTEATNHRETRTIWKMSFISSSAETSRTNQPTNQSTNQPNSKKNQQMNLKEKKQTKKKPRRKREERNWAQPVKNPTKIQTRIKWDGGKCE